tara:strand:+ start:122 stop:670 length:549 start_codon:yes stop_codon:yes gene_type:complete
MYGIINKSLKDMVLRQFGEPAWQRVMQSAQVDDDSFLTMRIYDDQVTYSLAAAAAEVLGLTLEDALRAFGVHWVQVTLQEQYETLMQATGKDMASFLRNLNALHDRISSTFLDYKPPHFMVEELSDGALKVTYISEREGLTPFVEGLLAGLAQRFNTSMSIRRIESVEVEQGEHTEFFLDGA